MDIILYNIGAVIILFLFGYLLGSIPNAIWIGKVFFHKDPRDFGSKNAGGTNAGRVFGKKVGVIVILLDALKMVIAIYVSWAILTKVPMYNGSPLMNGIEDVYVNGNPKTVIIWPVYWVAALGCSVGHCFPIFAQFKGGKNVSSFYGLIVCASWLIGFVPAVIFFIILKWKKYVSLASIVTSLVAVFLSWLWAILLLTGAVSGTTAWFINYGPSVDCNYVFAIVVTLNSLLLTYKHSGNIQMIKDGTERKITWMK